MADAAQASREPQRAPITFGLPQAAIAEEQSLLDAERERQKKRAERFGVAFRDPATSRTNPQLRYEGKKERLKREPQFALGFDVLGQEEQEKRRERAERFQLSSELANPIDNYKPDADLVLKAQRAEKYGIEYAPESAVLMEMDLFEERHEPAKDVARRRDAVYLYGVDVMSTKDVLSYWKDHGPTFVEWLNDSACNVLFADEYACKRAMVYRGHPLPPTSENLSAAGLDPTDINNLPFLWHQGEDFIKSGAAVKLIYRMSTADDIKKFDGERRTRELWKTGTEPESHKSRRRDRHSNPHDGMILDDQEVPSRGSRRRKTRDKDGQIHYKEDVEMEDADAGATRVAEDQTAAPATEEPPLPAIVFELKA